jgi:hypothetical protein
MPEKCPSLSHIPQGTPLSTNRGTPPITANTGLATEPDPPQRWQIVCSVGGTPRESESESESGSFTTSP